jgi:hypothetical protein
MRNPKSLWVYLLITFLLPASLGADQIRALIVEEVRIPSDSEYEDTVEISLEEAAVLHLEEKTQFLEGIRIELHLSNILKKYFDSYALAIYKNLSPYPQTSIRFYQGQKAFFQYLPYLNRIYVQVPIGASRQEETLPVGTYRLEQAVKKEDFPLLITMIPLTKGLPDLIADKKFYFSIRPLLEKKGFAVLSFHFPPGQETDQLTLFVDDREIPYPAGKQELSSGIHQLRILSSSFKEVNASFAVESGKSNVVDIYLEQIISQLTIEAPLGTELYLDGEKIAENAAFPLPVTEGTHLVRAKIADQSISKKFTVKKGKHYHISIIFDIFVNEN